MYEVILLFLLFPVGLFIVCNIGHCVAVHAYVIGEA